MAGTSDKRSGKRGFRNVSALVAREIREAGEARGFAVSRVLTHWAEIAGPDLASRTRPLKITYGKGGLGGTLTVLVPGAEAPMIEMQAERLRQRVNACYGYNAISRVRLTQTAPTGFAEGKAEFEPRPPEQDTEPTGENRARAAREAADIHDDRLRAALESLGANILSRPR